MTCSADAVRHALPPRARPGLLERLLRRFARVEAAMTGQRRLAELRPETLRDTGLSADDLTGVATHDPDLPFFLQSGFGRAGRR